MLPGATVWLITVDSVVVVVSGFPVAACCCWRPRITVRVVQQLHTDLSCLRRRVLQQVWRLSSRRYDRRNVGHTCAWNSAALFPCELKYPPTSLPAVPGAQGSQIQLTPPCYPSSPLSPRPLPFPFSCCGLWSWPSSRCLFGTAALVAGAVAIGTGRPPADGQAVAGAVDNRACPPHADRVLGRHRGHHLQS